MQNSNTHWALFFDGLCEPVNPGGVMAWGSVLHAAGKKYTDASTVDAAPTNTNNYAEYCALGFGLKLVHSLVGQGEACEGLAIFGDSQLVVRQLTGEWQCKTDRLRVLRDRCHELLSMLNVPWTAEWIPREQNEEADALGNAAYEKLTGKKVVPRRKSA